MEIANKIKLVEQYLKNCKTVNFDDIIDYIGNEIEYLSKCEDEYPYPYNIGYRVKTQEAIKAQEILKIINS